MGLWVRPLVAPITQLFGQLEGMPWGDCGPGGHPGTDYADPGGASLGRPIVAASSGHVSYAGPASGFGDHAVSIYHPDEDVTTTYGHMSSHLYAAGAPVLAGAQIGTCGDEGHATGPHLHLELRPGSAAFGAYPPNVDPDDFLHAMGAYGGPQHEGLLAAMDTIDTSKALNMAAPTIRTAQGLLGARGAWISPSNTSHAVLTIAVRWFQQTAGLPVDGMVGPATWSRLVQPLNGK